MTDAVAQLTAGQRDCLRLVLAHMTSKDIARALGISPHTVDMRLRTAMRTLGVASRIEAARLLVDHDSKAEPYQPLIYQPPELGRDAAAGEGAAPVETIRGDAAPPRQAWSTPEAPPAGGPPRLVGGRHADELYAVPLAGSLPWGPRNRLTPGARLVWIAMIAIGSALGFGAILAALEALKKLL